MDTDQVIAELRDLTKNVDVKTIKQSIRRCHGHTSQQNNDNSENTYRNKRVSSELLLKQLCRNLCL